MIMIMNLDCLLGLLLVHVFNESVSLHVSRVVVDGQLQVAHLAVFSELVVQFVLLRLLRNTQH